MPNWIEAAKRKPNHIRFFQMRRLLSVVAIALLASVTAASPALGQASAPAIVARTGYFGETAQTVHNSDTFDSTGASLLVVFVSTHPAWSSLPVAIEGISDSAGNTWTALAGPTLYGGTGYYPLLSGIYYVNTPTTSTTHSIIATLSNAAPLVMDVFAVRDSNTTTPPLTSAITNPGPTPSSDVTSASMNVPANALLLGWVKNETDATATALNPPWTPDSSSTTYLWSEYMTAVTAGSYQAQFSYSTAIGWQTAMVTIPPVSSAPVAQNVSVTTLENQSVATTLNATSFSNSPLTYTVTQPSHGSLGGIAPNLIYTPNTGYFGSDSSTYKVNDGTADSNIAIVSITVQSLYNPPVANNANLATGAGTPVAVTLRASDPNGFALTYTILTQPANGQLVGTAPNLTYTPNAGYVGNDSFTFKANDGYLDSNQATVTITVEPSGVVPTIVARTGYIQGTAQTTHTTATVPPFDSTGATTLVAFVSTNTPWPLANGVPISIVGVTDSVGNTWTPLTGPTLYSGTGNYPLLSGIYYVNAPATSDTHTFTATLSNPAPLVMDVFAVRDSNASTPPWTSAITNPGPTPSSDVTSASINVPANTLLLGWVKNETNATATALDSWTLDSSSTTYLWSEYMMAGAVGTYHDHFSYSTPIGWQTAVVGIPPVSAIPGAYNQSIATGENTPVSITLMATDVDNNPLTYVVQTSPAHGQLSGTAPNLVYTPASEYFGSDSFTFIANDGFANSNVATVALTVVPATTTSLTSSPNPSVLGEVVTLTATVTSLAGTPTGSVIFMDGTTTLGTGSLDANGQASLPVTFSIAGPHSITATYPGVSGRFGPSASQGYTQTVNQASTSSGADFTLSNTAPTISGGLATFTVSLSPVGGSTQTVNLSCSMSCTIAPNPVQLSGSGSTTVTVVVTMPTKLSMGVDASQRQTKSTRLLVAILQFGGLGLVLIGRRRRWLVLFLVLLCLAMGMVACGGNSSSSSVSATSVIITATPDSGTAHTITVNLT